MTNKAGRPPLEINNAQVRDLASFSLTIKDMAKILQCSVSHLNNNYLDVINEGRANLRTSILRKQYEVGITDGNVTMLIWMGKQHLGQADKKTVEIDDRRKAAELTDGELASIITGNSEEVVH